VCDVIIHGTIAQMKANPAWAPYVKEVMDFNRYLRETENLSFTFHGEQMNEGMLDDVTSKMPYKHRWTDIYRRGVLAKFYQLEKYLVKNPTPITMLSLTTFHGWNKFQQESQICIDEKGHLISILESFDMLKTNWRLLKQHIHHPYVWVMEPHETGYPHMHVIILGDLTEEEKNRIIAFWADKYGTSDKIHGAKFTYPPVKSIRNYLMKYMSKGFKKTGSKFGKPVKWTTGELVFFALVKKYRWRLFGATRDLVKVMKYTPKTTGEKTLYYATELHHKNGTDNLMWQRIEPTGWKNYTRVYREIEKASTDDERML
jgi:hypothetical protein